MDRLRGKFKRIHRQLEAQFTRLGFNVGDAYDIADTFHDSNFEKARSLWLAVRHIEKAGETIEARREASGGFYRSRMPQGASVDDFGHRFHSSLTQLPRELRCCLSVDGRPLVGVDIRNSQPFILAMELVTNYRKSNTPLPKDVFLFVELCAKGTLYDELMRLSGFTGSRDEFKEGFFPVFYSGPKRARGPVAEALKARFPTVWALMEGMKKKGKGAALLPQRMQRMESRIILEVVCVGLLKEHPEMPLFTIHDSIYTTLPYVPIVSKAIEDGCLRLGGLTPSLKVNT